MTNKEAIEVFKGFKFLPKEQKAVDLAIKALEQEPKTDILEQIIAEINTSNRGTCDYYIVDRIEEIINEYQKGGEEE